MRVRVKCDDKYEAQKLAGLIYINEERATNITKILNVIGNEIIICTRDGSAHSIVFGDAVEVERFADFVQSVLEGVHRITDTTALDDMVDVDKMQA